MPALQWCSRRWRIASDDFVFQGLAVSTAHLCLGIAAYTLLSDGQLNQESQKAAHCPGTSDALSSTVLAALIVHLLNTVLFALLAFTSMRGRILEPSKRAPVLIALYLVCAATLCQIGTDIATAHYAYTNNEISKCPGTVRGLLHFTIIGSIKLWIYLIISLVSSIDPHGSRDHAELRSSEQKYLELWQSRCRVLTKCCCVNTGDEEALSDVAVTMARLFDAHDIVFSDITTALVLIHSYQAWKLQRHAELVAQVTMPEYHFEKNSLRLSNQADFLRPIDATQRNELSRVQYFSRYYLAAYGYLLYWYTNFFSGMPRLWCSDCTMCCGSHPGTSVGDCCHCNSTAIRVVAKLDDDDLLLTSSQNGFLMPNFYVAVDRATSSVVIAVRGTMSINDAITDVVALPRQMPVHDLDSTGQGPCYAHGGMIKCADNVIEALSRHGILLAICTGQYSSFNVVVVGHSLGAGVATLIAIRLREMQGTTLETRLHCFAYAPPGGLLSRQLSEYSSRFVTAVFMGKDLVPRLAAHTMNDLRDSMFLALAATRHNKASVHLSVCFYPCASCCCDSSHDAEPPLPDVLEASAEELRRIIEMLRPTAHIGSPHTTMDAVASKSPAADSAPPTATAAAARQASSPFLSCPVAREALPSDRSTSTASGEEMRLPTLTAKPGRTFAGRTFETAGAETPMLPAPPNVKLYPPAKLIHLVKCAQRDSACACLCEKPGVGGCFKKWVYGPRWIEPEQCQEVLVSPYMMADHLPDRLFYALEGCLHDVDRHTLGPLHTAPAAAPPSMLYRPNVDVVSMGTHAYTPPASHSVLSSGYRR